MSIRVKVLGSGDYEDIFNQEDGYEVTTGKDFDLLCFTGGTDINPAFYGAERHRYTMVSDIKRDTSEVDWFRYCRARNIPMVGICRGAQLLCALSGGSLFQHVENHTRPHMMHVHGDESMTVTSSHHQMMDIRGMGEKAELLGWSEKRSPNYQTDKETFSPKDVENDAEVVFFPQTKALAHQPHPEWMDKRAPYPRFFFETIEKYLGVGHA